jgi:hypothetical protein
MWWSFKKLQVYSIFNQDNNRYNISIDIITIRVSTQWLLIVSVNIIVIMELVDTKLS